MKTSLTQEDHAALAKVKKAHGPTWRTALRKAWENGRVTALVGFDGPVSTLQRLRTKLGPTGLAKYRFPAEDKVDAAEKKHNSC